MKNFNPWCDCLGTDAEDTLCAAAHAMDMAEYVISRKEAEFFSYLVAKYGPANQD